MQEMRVIARQEGTRYSDMPDELQVRDRLSLKNLNCLTLPIHLMVDSKIGGSKNYSRNGVYDCVWEIEDLLRNYDYNVPIYDLRSRTKLDSLGKIDKVYRKYKG